jgi:hypothetical protein
MGVSENPNARQNPRLLGSLILCGAPQKICSSMLLGRHAFSSLNAVKFTAIASIIGFCETPNYNKKQSVYTKPTDFIVSAKFKVSTV